MPTMSQALLLSMYMAAKETDNSCLHGAYMLVDLQS